MLFASTTARDQINLAQYTEDNTRGLNQRRLLGLNVILSHLSPLSLSILLLSFKLFLLTRVLGKWVDIRNRRKFFEEFARTNGFDPLNAENWYRQSLTTILRVKVLRGERRGEAVQ